MVFTENGFASRPQRAPMAPKEDPVSHGSGTLQAPEGTQESPRKGEPKVPHGKGNLGVPLRSHWGFF